MNRVDSPILMVIQDTELNVSLIFIDFVVFIFLIFKTYANTKGTFKNGKSIQLRYLPFVKTKMGENKEIPVSLTLVISRSELN